MIVGLFQAILVILTLKIICDGMNEEMMSFRYLFCWCCEWSGKH